MKRSLLAIVVVLGCARAQYRSATADVVLTVDGRVRGAPIAFDPAGLATIQHRQVRGVDPRGGGAREYEGTSLLALVHELDPGPGVDLAVVHARSGEAVPVPLPAVRQYEPVLAERIGGRPAAEAVPGAGRFELAWPNADAPGFDVDPRARWWWVRDVTRIELVPWYETYGRALRVSPGAPDEARRGADRFATSCIQCHRLRDVGGKRGPDLSNGISREERERFIAAVRSHAEKVPDTRGVDLTQGVDEVAAFLEAVQVSGPPPPEETPPEMKPREEPPPGMRPPGRI